MTTLREIPEEEIPEGFQHDVSPAPTWIKPSLRGANYGKKFDGIFGTHAANGKNLLENRKVTAVPGTMPGFEKENVIPHCDSTKYNNYTSSSISTSFQVKSQEKPGQETSFGSHIYARATESTTASISTALISAADSVFSPDGNDNLMSESIISGSHSITIPGRSDSIYSGYLYNTSVVDSSIYKNSIGRNSNSMGRNSNSIGMDDKENNVDVPNSRESIHTGDSTDCHQDTQGNEIDPNERHSQIDHLDDGQGGLPKVIPITVPAFEGTTIEPTLEKKLETPPSAGRTRGGSIFKDIHWRNLRKGRFRNSISPTLNVVSENGQTSVAEGRSEKGTLLKEKAVCFVNPFDGRVDSSRNSTFISLEHDTLKAATWSKDGRETFVKRISPKHFVKRISPKHMRSRTQSSISSDSSSLEASPNGKRGTNIISSTFSTLVPAAENLIERIKSYPCDGNTINTIIISKEEIDKLLSTITMLENRVETLESENRRLRKLSTASLDTASLDTASLDANNRQSINLYSNPYPNSYPCRGDAQLDVRLSNVELASMESDRKVANEGMKDLMVEDVNELMMDKLPSQEHDSIEVTPITLVRNISPTAPNKKGTIDGHHSSDNINQDDRPDNDGESSPEIVITEEICKIGSKIDLMGRMSVIEEEITEEQMTSPDLSTKRKSKSSCSPTRKAVVGLKKTTPKIRNPSPSSPIEERTPKETTPTNRISCTNRISPAVLKEEPISIRLSDGSDSVAQKEDSVAQKEDSFAKKTFISCTAPPPNSIEVTPKKSKGVGSSREINADNNSPITDNNMSTPKTPNSMSKKRMNLIKKLEKAPIEFKEGSFLGRAIATAVRSILLIPTDRSTKTPSITDRSDRSKTTTGLTDTCKTRNEDMSIITASTNSIASTGSTSMVSSGAPNSTTILGTNSIISTTTGSSSVMTNDGSSSIGSNSVMTAGTSGSLISNLSSRLLHPFINKEENTTVHNSSKKNPNTGVTVSNTRNTTSRTGTTSGNTRNTTSTTSTSSGSSGTTTTKTVPISRRHNNRKCHTKCEVIVDNCPISVVNFLPHVSEEMRDIFGLKREEFLYEMSSKPLTGGHKGDGKSGSLFFGSRSGKFIIKTLKDTEMRTIISLYDDYLNHCKKYKNITLLPKYFMVFRLSYHKNLICPKDKDMKRDTKRENHGKDDSITDGKNSSKEDDGKNSSKENHGKDDSITIGKEDDGKGGDEIIVENTIENSIENKKSSSGRNENLKLNLPAGGSSNNNFDNFNLINSGEDKKLPTDLRFLVMPNIWRTDLKLHERYDLKGSVWNRFSDIGSKQELSTKTLKDQNFILDGTRYLRFPIISNTKTEIDLRQKFEEAIKYDVKFLENHQLMDYSLLIGIHFCKKYSNQRDNYHDVVDNNYHDVVVSSTDNHRDNFQESSVSSSVSSDPNIWQTEVVRPRRLLVGLPASNQDNSTVQLLKEPKEPKDFFSTDFTAARMSLDRDILSNIGVPAIHSIRGREMNVRLFLGIVDILQTWTTNKYAENILKSNFLFQKNISSVDPYTYGERFKKFLLRKCFPPIRVLSRFNDNRGKSSMGTTIGAPSSNSGSIGNTIAGGSGSSFADGKSNGEEHGKTTSTTTNKSKSMEKKSKGIGDSLQSKGIGDSLQSKGTGNNATGTDKSKSSIDGSPKNTVTPTSLFERTKSTASDRSKTAAERVAERAAAGTKIASRVLGDGAQSAVAVTSQLSAESAKPDGASAKASEPQKFSTQVMKPDIQRVLAPSHSKPILGNLKPSSSASSLKPTSSSASSNTKKYDNLKPVLAARNAKPSNNTTNSDIPKGAEILKGVATNIEIPKGVVSEGIVSRERAKIETGSKPKVFEEPKGNH